MGSGCPKNLGSSIDQDEKSMPPRNMPINGMIMSFTREEVMVLKAPPIITPIARSNTLPLRANYEIQTSAEQNQGGYFAHGTAYLT